MKLTNQIEGYEGYMWKREINVRDFIQHNYVPFSDFSKTEKYIPFYFLTSYFFITFAHK